MLRQINYQENSKQALKQLDRFTEAKLPAVTELPNQEISFIYEMEGEVLGRVAARIHFNCLYIDYLVVQATTRNTGVGSQLLHKIEAVAKKAKCQMIFLETFSFNAPHFYLKQGYKVIEKVDNSPVEGESHYFMLKTV